MIDLLSSLPESQQYIDTSLNVVEDKSGNI